MSLPKLSKITVDSILNNLDGNLKEKLYQALHEELYGGVTKLRDPDYVIFRYRYTDRLRSSDAVRTIHSLIRKYAIEDESLHVLTLSWDSNIGHHYYTVYPNGSAEEHEYYPQCYSPDENITMETAFTEHPELKNVTEAIKAKVQQMKVRSQGSFFDKYTTDVCLVKIREEMSFSVIESFESVIRECEHCGGLGSGPYEVEEFEIMLNGQTKIVQFRNYDTESG